MPQDTGTRETAFGGGGDGTAETVAPQPSGETPGSPNAATSTSVQPHTSTAHKRTPPHNKTKARANTGSPPPPNKLPPMQNGRGQELPNTDNTAVRIRITPGQRSPSFSPPPASSHATSTPRIPTRPTASSRPWHESTLRENASYLLQLVQSNASSSWTESSTDDSTITDIANDTYISVYGTEDSYSDSHFEAFMAGFEAAAKKEEQYTPTGSVDDQDAYEEGWKQASRLTLDSPELEFDDTLLRQHPTSDNTPSPLQTLRGSQHDWSFSDDDPTGIRDRSLYSPPPKRRSPRGSPRSNKVHPGVITIEDTHHANTPDDLPEALQDKSEPVVIFCSCNKNTACAIAVVFVAFILCGTVVLVLYLQSGNNPAPTFLATLAPDTILVRNTPAPAAAIRGTNSPVSANPTAASLNPTAPIPAPVPAPMTQPAAPSTLPTAGTAHPNSPAPVTSTNNPIDSNSPSARPVVNTNNPTDSNSPNVAPVVNTNSPTDSAAPSSDAPNSVAPASQTSTTKTDTSTTSTGSSTTTKTDTSSSSTKSSTTTGTELAPTDNPTDSSAPSSASPVAQPTRFPTISQFISSTSSFFSSLTSTTTMTTTTAKPPSSITPSVAPTTGQPVPQPTVGSNSPTSPTLFPTAGSANPTDSVAPVAAPTERCNPRHGC